MKRYILLTSILPSHFKLTVPDMKELAKGYNCQVLLTVDRFGNPVVYFTSSTPDHLSELCTGEELDGIVLEYSGVYDQVVSLE